MEENLIEYYVNKYNFAKSIYDKIYAYYKNHTDSMRDYKMVTARSNNKINANYIKKFIKEEVSYIVGNQVTYSGEDEAMMNDIDKVFSHWSYKHDGELAKQTILYGEAYELYYIKTEIIAGEQESLFCAKVLSPRNSIIAFDEQDKPAFLMYFYKKEADSNEYMDLIEPFKVTTYTVNGRLQQVSTKSHIFDEVPIGISKISEEGYQDTLYTDLKGLQDAYETNFSDISNEISDFRQAYLLLTGIDIKEEDAKDLKKLGIMKIPNAEGKAEWLIKNINDGFIDNTLSRIKEDMYEIASHINSNEKLSSNTSSLALRTRMISLDMKCKLNENALADCIGIDRIKFLFKFLNVTKNKKYDYRDVKAIFTVNIPQDDLMTAQVLSQTPEGIISKETARSRFSFIDDTSLEASRVEKEEETYSIGGDLLESARHGYTGTPTIAGFGGGNGQGSQTTEPTP